MTFELARGAALVVVDLQVATTSIPSAADMPTVVAHALDLTEAFRRAGRPVVLARTDLNQPPPGRTTFSAASRPAVPDAALAFVPGLAPTADDLVLDKRGWSAFAGTDLDRSLRKRDVTQVVVAGLATNYGIESTARQAYDLGYDVVVVRDATNNPVARGHEHSLTQVFPALGLVVDTADVVAALAAPTS